MNLTPRQAAIIKSIVVVLALTLSGIIYGVTVNKVFGAEERVEPRTAYGCLAL